jgi:magnesium-transporting ATPase (P-type)
VTKDHLDKFAKAGLRTLCYAVKVINEKEFTTWENKYKEIKYQFLSDKSKKPELEASISEIETKCILQGVSGLEDRLQDEVRDTVQEFIDAGIQMWMLTGDKLDTAESIGYSSKFFDEDTEVFKIKKILYL